MVLTESDVHAFLNQAFRLYNSKRLFVKAIYCSGESLSKVLLSLLGRAIYIFSKQRKRADLFILLSVCLSRVDLYDAEQRTSFHHDHHRGEFGRVVHRPGNVSAEPDGRAQRRRPPAITSGLIDHHFRRRSLHPHRSRFRGVENRLQQFSADRHGRGGDDDNDGDVVRSVAADRKRSPLHHHPRFAALRRSFLATVTVVSIRCFGCSNCRQRLYDNDAPVAGPAQRKQQQQLVAQTSSAARARTKEAVHAGPGRRSLPQSEPHRRHHQSKQSEFVQSSGRGRSGAVLPCHEPRGQQRRWDPAQARHGGSNDVGCRHSNAVNVVVSPSHGVVVIQVKQRRGERRRRRRQPVHDDEPHGDTVQAACIQRRPKFVVTRDADVVRDGIWNQSECGADLALPGAVTAL